MLYIDSGSKSWITYTNTEVIFKNQSGDSSALNYSSLIDTAIEVFWNCDDGCKNCNPEEFHQEKLSTELSNYRFYFIISILAGGFPDYSTYDSIYINRGQNNNMGGILENGKLTDKTIIYYDEIQLNNTTFNDVYVDTTPMVGYDSGLNPHYNYIPVYFTKHEGIVAFAEDSTILWVKQ